MWRTGLSIQPQATEKDSEKFGKKTWTLVSGRFQKRLYMDVGVR